MITHEYGHAIHFSQNFSFDSVEAGAISEGFGDYWAFTVSKAVAGPQFDEALGASAEFTPPAPTPADP